MLEGAARPKSVKGGFQLFWFIALDEPAKCHEKYSGKKRILVKRLLFPRFEVMSPFQPCQRIGEPGKNGEEYSRWFSGK